MGVKQVKNTGHHVFLPIFDLCYSYTPKPTFVMTTLVAEHLPLFSNIFFLICCVTVSIFCHPLGDATFPWKREPESTPSSQHTALAQCSVWKATQRHQLPYNPASGLRFVEEFRTTTSQFSGYWPRERQPEPFGQRLVPRVGYRGQFQRKIRHAGFLQTTVGIG